MSIKSAIYGVLNDVGPTFPAIAPEGTKAPYIRYLGIGGEDEQTYDGDGYGATQGSVQVDAFALDYGSAERLAQSARRALYDAAALTVGKIIDLPDDYEEKTKLFKVSFQVDAWE
jgi:hypothetical protein